MKLNSNLITLLIVLALSSILTSCNRECPQCPQCPKDELAEMVKDLDPNTYLLKFTNSSDKSVIARDEYGNASEFIMVPPEKLGLKIRNSVPLKTLIIRTCPSMIRDLQLAKSFTELAAKVKIENTSDISTIEFNSGVLIAGNNALTQLRGLNEDAFDKDIMKGAEMDKVLMLFPSDNLPKGATRDFYGNADLFALFKWKKIHDFFPPKLMGCFDPQYLKMLKENLAKMNPEKFGNLRIEELGDGAYSLN